MALVLRGSQMGSLGFYSVYPGSSRNCKGGREMEFATSVNIRVTRGKVGRYAAAASIGSMDKRVSISRRKIPYGLTWP